MNGRGPGHVGLRLNRRCGGAWHVAPQSVDTKTLLQLSNKWGNASPYPAFETALKELRGAGSRFFISGHLRPGLRGILPFDFFQLRFGEHP